MNVVDITNTWGIYKGMAALLMCFTIIWRGWLYAPKNLYWTLWKGKILIKLNIFIINNINT